MQAELEITFSLTQRSGYWLMTVAGTSGVLSTEEFLALPGRLQSALRRAERESRNTGWRPTDSLDDGLSPELQAKIEAFNRKYGPWQLPPRPAQGVKAPKQSPSRMLPTLEDLDL